MGGGRGGAGWGARMHALDEFVEVNIARISRHVCARMRVSARPALQVEG